MALALVESRSGPSALGKRSQPNLKLKPVDGGLDYYAKFSNALPTRSTYFPVGVWLRSALSASDVNKDKSVGLNLYVGVSDPEGSELGILRQHGMKALLQADERTRFSDIGSETAGWLLADEIDMTEGPGACNGTLQSILNGLPGDDRARYNNYGKGVLLWQSNAEAACFVEAQALVSSDLYWFTDPNQVGDPGETWLPEGERPMSASEVRRASNYGYQIDRMRDLDARDGDRKPIWAFVEVGWPFTESGAQGGRAIQPREIRAAVWHSLIAGARGVLYFDHSFGGPCDDSVLRGHCYPENREMVDSVNREIKKLAPVLNARTLKSHRSVDGPVRAMFKWRAGHFFVFAGSKEHGGGNARFKISCLGRARAKVLGEGRHVPVRNGAFSDQFADGNSIHIYRVSDGSRCGIS